MRAPKARLARLVRLAVVVLLVCSGCGLFSQGTVVSRAPAADDADQQPQEASPIPIATPDGKPLPDDAIVIGALMASTGLLAVYDEPALVAARIRIDALNEAGGLLGRPVVLRLIDSHTEMSSIRNGAEQLLLDGVDMVLMTCDAAFAVPALDVLEGSGTLVISPCGTDDSWITGELGERVFSMATPAGTEAMILVELLADRGFGTAAVVIDRTSTEAVSVCEQFKREFESTGGRVVGFYRYHSSSPWLLDPILGGLADRNPEAIVFCGTRLVAPEILTPIRAAGIVQPIFANSTMDGDFWIGRVSGVGDFTMLSYASVFQDTPDPSPAVRELLAEYLAVTGHRANDGRVVTGADAIEAYARAVKRAGTTEPGAVAGELERFDGEELAAGPTTFGPGVHAAVGRPMRIITLQGPYARYQRILVPPSLSE
ncbi:ABC transporter substrate-binding protein [Candidatus Poriferisocius sp.]|uniref:ABC transporter substrate-binding protein n=1 Tax=Candidatus Poriferisocius sp. TaxID=3101276 RepID=UPI003B0280A5